MSCPRSHQPHVGAQGALGRLTPLLRQEPLRPFRAQAFVLQATVTTHTPPDRGPRWLQHGTGPADLWAPETQQTAWPLAQSGSLEAILLLSPALEESPLKRSPCPHCPSTGRAGPGTQAHVLIGRPERDGGPCSTREDTWAHGLRGFCRPQPGTRAPGPALTSFALPANPRVAPTAHLTPQEPRVLETGRQSCNFRGRAGK